MRIHLKNELESDIDLLGLKAHQGINLRLKTRQGKDKKLTRTKQIMIRHIIIIKNGKTTPSVSYDYGHIDESDTNIYVNRNIEDDNNDNTTSSPEEF